MFGSRERPCWEKRLLSSKEFASRGGAGGRLCCSFHFNVGRALCRGKSPALLRPAAGLRRVSHPSSLWMLSVIAFPATRLEEAVLQRQRRLLSALTSPCATAAPYPLLRGLSSPSLLGGSPCLLPPRRTLSACVGSGGTRVQLRLQQTEGGFCSLPATSWPPAVREAPWAACQSLPALPVSLLPGGGRQPASRALSKSGCTHVVRGQGRAVLL